MSKCDISDLLLIFQIESQGGNDLLRKGMPSWGPISPRYTPGVTSSLEDVASSSFKRFCMAANMSEVEHRSTWDWLLVFSDND